jgi:hypothetical protein
MENVAVAMAIAASKSYYDARIAATGATIYTHARAR